MSKIGNQNYHLDYTPGNLNSQMTQGSKRKRQDSKILQNLFEGKATTQKDI